MVVLRPDMSEDERLAFTQKYEELLVAGGGMYVEVFNRGVIQLAYAIRKKNKVGESNTYLDDEKDTVLWMCVVRGDLAFLLSEKVGIKGMFLRTYLLNFLVKKCYLFFLYFFVHFLGVAISQVIALDFSKEQLEVAKSRQRERLKACYMNIDWLDPESCMFGKYKIDPREVFCSTQLSYALVISSPLSIFE